MVFFPMDSGRKSIDLGIIFVGSYLGGPVCAGSHIWKSCSNNMFKVWTNKAMDNTDQNYHTYNYGELVIHILKREWDESRAKNNART